jgi:hypothetical protein
LRKDPLPLTYVAVLLPAHEDAVCVCVRACVRACVCVNTNVHTHSYTCT